ncbi:hypothetical protein AAFC00_000583 [Neodothiora populina]|uniref:2Fe-2S ferredoxin-type domain-containing protein n=1 Tax=Neodothiora populina TaxID=2781224 RepID=A0ABR3PDF7_9PEZI
MSLNLLSRHLLRSTHQAVCSTPRTYSAACLTRSTLSGAAYSPTPSSSSWRTRTQPCTPSTRLSRSFTASSPLAHGHLTPPKPGEERKVTFVDKEGDEHTFVVADGDNLLDVAQANDLEMEGACGGSCACSTCHIIIADPDMFDQMPEPDDDENDMLDLAFGLTETSRLGCQVKMSPELDGLVVKLPSMTRNLQASDFSRK